MLVLFVSLPLALVLVLIQAQKLRNMSDVFTLSFFVKFNLNIFSMFNQIKLEHISFVFYICMLI